MGDCQNYGPFLGPYYNTGPNTGPNLGDPKRDHNFDNPPNMPSAVDDREGSDDALEKSSLSPRSTTKLATLNPIP